MEPNTTANFILEGKQLLVKRSFVNGCLAELRTQIVDELQNCVFLRVVKTSPELKKDTVSDTFSSLALRLKLNLSFITLMLLLLSNLEIQNCLSWCVGCYS